MHITQLRNATIIVGIGRFNILVDPMLAPEGALPPLRLQGGRRQRKPTVGLPASADAALDSVTTASSPTARRDTSTISTAPARTGCANARCRLSARRTTPTTCERAG